MQLKQQYCQLLRLKEEVDHRLGQGTDFGRMKELILSGAGTGLFGAKTERGTDDHAGPFSGDMDGREANTSGLRNSRRYILWSGQSGRACT